MRQTWWAREASWGRYFERGTPSMEVRSGLSTGASILSDEIEKGRLHISQILDWVDSSFPGRRVASGGGEPAVGSALELEPCPVRL